MLILTGFDSINSIYRAFYFLALIRCFFACLRVLVAVWRSAVGFLLWALVLRFCAPQFKQRVTLVVMVGRRVGSCEAHLYL